MVKIRLPKSKKFRLLGALFIVSAVFLVAAIFILQSSNNPEKETATTSENQQQTSAVEDENSPNPKDSPQQLTPPEMKVPEVCSKIIPSIDQNLGVGSKLTGNTSSTENSAKLTDCNFTKDKTIANVKIYEYPGESEAAEDFEKRQIGGSASKNVGRYNVFVVVAREDGVDSTKSNAVLDFTVEKL